MDDTPASPELAPQPPAPDRRALWWEVAAVLAVGFMPHAVSAVTHLAAPAPPLPYWLDSLNLGVLSGCTILVTAYLIGRGGEPWERFGLPRPRTLDVPLGGLMLLVAELLWRLIPPVPDLGVRAAPAFVRPSGPVDHALMVGKFALGAFAEELVMRAYLITRLGVLLRSRGEAVVFAAALFASYHAYQGSVGFAYSLAFGLAYGVIFLGLGRVWPLALGHALYNVRIELLTA